MISYQIISTGSQGNATVIEKSILIDCGVPFKALYDNYKDLRLVLLTHIHKDHFNNTTIKRLAKERPTLRFGCCPWLVQPLIDCGVSKKNIDVYSFDKMYSYGICNVIPVYLKHNVPNCGYKLHFSTGKMIYATDCNNLNGITAPHYDLYLIEANYEDETIKNRIRKKKELGIYPYEMNVLKNHLSKKKCDDFIINNADSHSRFVYMHQHDDSKDKEVFNNEISNSEDIAI